MRTLSAGLLHLRSQTQIHEAEPKMGELANARSPSVLRLLIRVRGRARTQPCLAGRRKSTRQAYNSVAPPEARQVRLYRDKSATSARSGRADRRVEACGKAERRLITPAGR